MNLPGRLTRTTLGDLLGMLHREGASGILELVESSGARAGRSHRVFFSGGLVDDVETDEAHPPLGELLVREGALDRGALATLLRRLVSEPGRRAGEILVTERLANETLVGAALRWQLRARLDALFRLSDGHVRFHARRGRDRSRLSAVLSPRDFLHGRRRARAGGGSRATELLREGVEKDAAYRLLGLEPGADATSVRHAYRRLAAERHPDRHPGASVEELRALVREFTRLTTAYQTLSAK
jgi:DnaJ-domain-containing protein 1